MKPDDDHFPYEREAPALSRSSNLPASGFAGGSHDEGEPPPFANEPPAEPGAKRSCVSS